MKRINRFVFLQVLIFFASSPAIAQKGNNLPSKKWVPVNGYWVIESNTHTPKTNIFYFYSDNDSLIYTEKIEGRRISIKSKSTLKKLKSLLDNSLLTWDRANKARADGSLVQAILKIKK